MWPPVSIDPSKLGETSHILGACNEHQRSIYHGRIRTGDFESDAATDARFSNKTKYSIFTKYPKWASNSSGFFNRRLSAIVGG